MIKLLPVTKDYLWGGEKLKTLFGVKADGIVAECWTASIHKDGASLIENGAENFAAYLKSHAYTVDKKGGDFPVLIKYIDAKNNLSVQVHPSDEYALKHENSLGKTEAWYIISAEKGAGIYCGFKRDTNKSEFLEKVKSGSVEELLNFIPVKAGDCYLINAGTVHAIGAGCVICEVQQNSNITYRVYDYNRRGADGKLRELHVDKAVEVIDFNKFNDKTGTENYKNIRGGKIRLLTKCKYFSLKELLLSGEFCGVNDDSFTVINVIKGGGKINDKPFCAGDCFYISLGEKFALSGEADVLITAE